MIKLIKTLLIVIAIALSLLFLLLENPNEFKSEIAEIVSLNTPYRVSIKGDLSWRYWPPVAIQAEDIVLIGADGSSLAHIELLEIDVDLIPLLSRQHIVDVNSLTLSGGRIDYEIKGTGTSNWTAPAANETRQSNILPPPPTIHQFKLNDVRINYIAEHSYTVMINHLSTSRLVMDSPFDISTSVEILDQETKGETKVEATGQLIYGSTNRMRFDRIVSSIKHQEEVQLNIKASGELHPNRKVILLNELDIVYENLVASLTGIVNFAGEPIFEGELSLETTNLSELIDSNLPINQLKLTSGLVAAKEDFRLIDIDGHSEVTPVKGNLSFGGPDLINLTGDLRFDELKLPDSRASSQLRESSFKKQTPVDPELLPQALRTRRVNLILRANKVRYGDFDFSMAKVEIKSDKNKLEMIANSRMLDGKLVSSLDSDWLDSRLVISVDRVDISTLTDSRTLTGRLTGHADLNFSGTRLSDLEQNLAGKTVLNITEGSIDVRPIKDLAVTIDSLRGKRSSISSWPDDIHFQNMSAQHLFQNGTYSGQVLNARIENLHLTALGGFNLAQKTLDYKLTTMFEPGKEGQFQVSDKLAGIRWPMRCQGNFHEEPREICFGQQAAIQEIITSIARQELKRRGNKKLDRLIEEKVPEQLQDLTRDLLKDLFK